MKGLASHPILISCEVQADVPAVGSTALTVGDRFSLSCQSDEELTFKGTPQILFSDVKDQWNLKVLQIKNPPQNGDFTLEVTSYKAGEFKDQSFILTDGQVFLKVEKVSWTIQSVLKQDSQPYPAYGPMTLSYPLALWFALLLAILLMGLFVARVYKQRKRRSEILTLIFGEESLKVRFKNRNSLFNKEAFILFLKESRNIQKKIRGLSPAEPLEIQKLLDQWLRSYLMNEFFFDTRNSNWTKISKEFKDLYPKIYFKYQKSLSLLFKEMDNCHQSQLSMEDCHQVFAQIKSACEALHNEKKRSSL